MPGGGVVETKSEAANWTNPLKPFKKWKGIAESVLLRCQVVNGDSDETLAFEIRRDSGFFPLRSLSLLALRHWGGHEHVYAGAERMSGRTKQAQDLEHLRPLFEDLPMN